MKLVECTTKIAFFLCCYIPLNKTIPMKGYTGLHAFAYAIWLLVYSTIWS